MSLSLKLKRLFLQFSDIEINKTRIAESVLFVSIAGVLTMVFMFVNSAVVDSLIDIDVVCVFVTVAVSVDSPGKN